MTRKVGVTEGKKLDQGFCPCCGTHNEGVTGVSMADGPGEMPDVRLPEPGDLSVCATCGTVCQYDQNLKLQTIENWKEVVDSPEHLELIEGLQEQFKKRGKIKNSWTPRGNDA